MNSQRHSLRPFTQDTMKAALPILRAFFEFDTADEDAETIEGTLSKLSNAALGAITIHSHTIQDNNRPTSVAFGSVSSNRAESITPANLALDLSGASGKRVTVAYAVTGGTATGGDVDDTLASGTPSSKHPTLGVGAKPTLIAMNQQRQ